MRAYLIARPEPIASRADLLASGADALVLERGESDSVAALAEILGWARAQGVPRACPRLPALDDPDTEAALAVLMPSAPDAVVAAVVHGRDVTHLGARLAVHEAEAGLPDGSTRIVAILDGPSGVLNAASLVGASARLVAIGWEAASLAGALGAPRAIDEAGWIGPLAQARGAVRLAAAAAGVEALDSDLAADDPQAFARALAAARRDGFAGMMARNPEQVAAIRLGRSRVEPNPEEP